MLPYCDQADWACFRGIILGILSLGTLVVSLYAIRQIISVGNWPRKNVLMLALTGFQMLVLVVQFLIYRSPQILFLEKYCRGIQIGITCLLYGHLATSLQNSKTVFRVVLLPFVFLVAIVMTANYTFMLSSEEVDCHHLSWLLMSISSAVLAVTFAIAGVVILGEIKSASALQHQYVKLLGDGQQKGLEQAHEQLWILLLCNTFSAMLQLLLDIYIESVVVGSKTCDATFFVDENFELEQLLRLILAFCGYIIPEWATIYVFYWIPRHQFSTHLDLNVPDIDDGGCYKEHDEL